jgi:hypothetical protein
LLTYNIAETVTYLDGNEIGDIYACGLQSKLGWQHYSASSSSLAL